MELLSGGRLVAAALKRHGVTHLFTLCGGHIQAIYDGCLDEQIRVIDVRHEQTAGHAADGWARVTGRPGVCAVTAGPGVTDVVTAVANAQRAGSPMIVLGGAGPYALRDMGSLQDMDAVTLMRPITKWSVQVPETRRIVEYVDAAFRVAQSGVPGPVFLELPLDLLMNAAPFDAPTAPFEPPHGAGDPAAIGEAARLLAAAERPAVLVGNQLRWSPARDRLRAAADAWQLPFYLSGMARGGLPPAHPQLFTRSRKLALSRADLVVTMGVPFDFRVDYGRWAPDARVVQIDLDPAELGRNRKITVPIQGDSGLVLGQLLAALPRKESRTWLETLRAEETRKRAAMQAQLESNASPPNPLRVCHELDQLLGPDDVVIGDGGDFVATAANVLHLEWPQLWLDPGPLGTLGIGPGFAMAARLARPASRVVIVYGDGSFGLHALEFEALVRQGIPVVAVIGNDAAWSQIRRGQVAMYGAERAIATRLSHARYDKVVEALGGFGAWVERVEDLRPALEAAFAAGVPACVNVRIGESDFRQGAISV
jgi:acetolactate synthase-1/2/3 large subunit